jgi:hypothetical protein
MRVIFEEVDGEYFFEIILTPYDLEKLDTYGGIIGDFAWEGNGVRDINVYIRKEKESDSCHSSKERKHPQKRGSLKISEGKNTLTQKCQPNRPLLSLLAKRAGAKRKLPKKERSNG